MYILKYLHNFDGTEHDNKHVNFEYRLACSGELYNANVETSDYRKSTACRYLFNGPFAIFICSEPFYDYPQELCLRFKCPMFTERSESVTSSFYPDEEIAEDLSSLLTLFCRRLITIVCKTRQEHGREHEHEPEVIYNWPVPFINSLEKNVWPRKKASVAYTPKGVDITDYNPSPKGVDITKLSDSFRLLSNLEDAEAYVLSARLYFLALQLIEKHPDISYLLLISSVETMSSTILKIYEPSREDMIGIKQSVRKQALSYGLDSNQSDELAIKACEGMSWTKKKFIKFLCNYVNSDLWTEDDLFKIPDFLLPQEGNYEKTLSSIYDARGKMQHAGHFFPQTSGIGSQATIPSRIYFSSMQSILESKELFPPVFWFERVVNMALNNFLFSQKVEK